MKLNSGIVLSSLGCLLLGGVCGWWLRGTPRASESEEGRNASRMESVAVRQSPMSTEARNVSRGNGEAPAAAAQNEPVFEEAISAEEFRREQAKNASVATVEDVRDEEGLTAEEAQAKYRREHPEEWEALQKRRAAILASRQKAVAEKRAFLDSVDPAFFTPEQAKLYTSFKEALATRDELRERINAARRDGKSITPDDQTAYSRAAREVRVNTDAVRRALFEAAGRSAGYEGKDVGEFADLVQKIVDATSGAGGRR